MRTTYAICLFLVLFPLGANALSDHKEIAHAAFREGKFRVAIEYYERAGEVTLDASAKLELARSFLMNEEFERAMLLASGVLKSAPRNTNALILAGDIEAAQGHWHAAAERYAAATTSENPRREIWLSLGQALQYDGKPTMAEFAFDAYRRMASP